MAEHDTDAPNGTGSPPDGLDALHTRVAGERDALDSLGTVKAGAGDAVSVAGGDAGALPAGHVLEGHLMMIRVVGQGAMGVVYEALDTRTQARYAVKMLRPEWARRPDAMGLLRQEVAAAQAVTHQNLLKVNYLKEGEPYAYLVMEYLDGADLATYLAQRGGKVPLEDGLKILRQVAAGLDHLHAKGLVHQDVKPQNLFVTQTGEVRVLDYGIAKVVRAYGAPGAQASGGTLAYMAPEQLRGEAVDRRADVYAFGLVCVEVLTGKLPFDVRDAKAVTAWHLDSGHAMPSLPAGSPAKSMTACLAVDSSARPLSAGVALVELVQDEERRAEVSQGIAREHAASGQAVPSRTAKGVIHYAGQSALFDITLSVSLDGRVMGNGSFKRGFQFPFEVGEGAHLLSVRAYKFLTMTFPLDFEAGGEYVITLSDLNVGQEKCDVRRAK